jgi:hypothetical protein
MKTTRGIIRSLRAPMLLAATVLGLAFSASGCLIESSSPGPTCSPDLYVNWRIVESGTGNILTCADVPATTIRVNVSGQVTDVGCSANASMGSIPIYLDVTGTYTVMVQLLNGGTILSETGSNAIDVDCSGLTDTPVIDLEVI